MEDEEIQNEGTKEREGEMEDEETKNEGAKGKETNSNIVHPAVGRLFPPLPRHGTRLSRSRESRNVKSSNLSCDEFFEHLEQK